MNGLGSRPTSDVFTESMKLPGLHVCSDDTKGILLADKTFIDVLRDSAGNEVWAVFVNLPLLHDASEHELVGCQGCIS